MIIQINTVEGKILVNGRNTKGKNMAIFTKAKAAEHFGSLWSKMIQETDFRSKIREENLSITYVCHDPDLTMYVDADGVLFDEKAEGKTPTVIMKMDTATAHLFWLGKLNVPKAMALKQIKAKGSVGKILQLIPMLEPGQKLYPDLCKANEIPTE